MYSGIVSANQGLHRLPHRLCSLLPPQDDLWGRVLDALAESELAQSAQRYKKLDLVSVETDRIVLRTPPSFVAQFVQTPLLRALGAALSQDVGGQVGFEIKY